MDFEIGFDPIGQQKLFVPGASLQNITSYRGPAPTGVSSLEGLGTIPKTRGRNDLKNGPIPVRVSIAKHRNNTQAEYGVGDFLFGYDTLSSIKDGEPIDGFTLTDLNWKLEFVERNRRSRLQSEVSHYGKRKANLDDDDETPNFVFSMQDFLQKISFLGIIKAADVDPYSDPRSFTIVPSGSVIIPNLTGKFVKTGEVLWGVVKIVSNYYTRFYNEKGHDVGHATAGSYPQVFIVSAGEGRRIYNNYCKKNEDPSNVINCTDFYLTKTVEEVSLEITSNNREPDYCDPNIVGAYRRALVARSQTQSITFNDYDYGYAFPLGVVTKTTYGVPSADECKLAHRSRDVYNELLTKYPLVRFLVSCEREKKITLFFRR